MDNQNVNQPVAQKDPNYRPSGRCGIVNCDELLPETTEKRFKLNSQYAKLRSEDPFVKQIGNSVFGPSCNLLIQRELRPIVLNKLTGEEIPTGTPYDESVAVRKVFATVSVAKILEWAASKQSNNNRVTLLERLGMKKGVETVGQAALPAPKHTDAGQKARVQQEKVQKSLNGDKDALLPAPAAPATDASPPKGEGSEIASNAIGGGGESPAPEPVLVPSVVVAEEDFPAAVQLPMLKMKIESGEVDGNDPEVQAKIARLEVLVQQDEEAQSQAVQDRRRAKKAKQAARAND